MLPSNREGVHLEGRERRAKVTGMTWSGKRCCSLYNSHQIQHQSNVLIACRSTVFQDLVIAICITDERCAVRRQPVFKMYLCMMISPTLCVRFKYS